MNAYARGRPVTAETPPTIRQVDVLRAIARYHAEHGHSPTHRELAGELGINGRDGVKKHLLALQLRGLLSWSPGAMRSIQLTPRGESWAAGESPVPQLALMATIAQARADLRVT